MSATAQLKTVVTGQPQVPATASKDPVVAALMQAQSKMKSLLPAHITPEKMLRLALGELRLNQTLANTAAKNPTSLVSAVMTAASLGLEVGGAKGHGYLVPYNGEVKFMPGYRGLIQLARQSGQVTSISVHIVYDRDTFDLQLGVDETITHKPLLEGDRGKPRFVYGVARFTDGSHHFDWMTIDQVEKIRKLSKQANAGPWKDHYDEMVRKTMVRRLAKYLPMSSDRLESAIAHSDSVDNGGPVTFDGDFRELDAGAGGSGNDPLAPGKTLAEFEAEILAAGSAELADLVMDEARSVLNEADATKLVTAYRAKWGN